MANPAQTLAEETTRTLASAAQDGARHAEGLVDAAGEAIRNSAGQGEATMRRMSDGLQRGPAEAMSAASEMNRAMLEGAQEMAREWAELLQSGYKRGADRMGQAMNGGSPADLAMLQPTLAREAMESWIAAATRMTDISLRTAERASKAWTGTASRAVSGAGEPRPYS